MLARIIEPTSKADSIRVPQEVGVTAPALNTIYRSLRRCQERDYRDPGNHRLRSRHTDEDPV